MRRERGAQRVRQQRGVPRGVGSEPETGEVVEHVACSYGGGFCSREVRVHGERAQVVGDRSVGGRRQEHVAEARGVDGSGGMERKMQRIKSHHANDDYRYERHQR